MAKKSRGTIFLIVGIALAIILFGGKLGLFSAVADNPYNLCELKENYEGIDLDCNVASNGYGEYLWCNDDAWAWVQFEWIADSVYVDSFTHPVHYGLDEGIINKVTITNLQTNQITTLATNVVYSSNTQDSFVSVEFVNPYLLKQGIKYKITFEGASCSSDYLFRFNPSKYKLDRSEFGDWISKSYRGSGSSYSAGEKYPLFNFNMIEDFVFVCSDGDNKCEGTNYYTCSNNEWVDKGKVIGKCGVECLQDDTKCIGTVYYACANNQWESAGQIVGHCGYQDEQDCTSNDKKCEGTTYYVCDNGSWESQGLIDGKCGYSDSGGSGNDGDGNDGDGDVIDEGGIFDNFDLNNVVFNIGDFEVKVWMLLLVIALIIIFFIIT